MSFIAGPYTYTYNDANLGISEDGFELEQTYYSEAIRGDNAGSAHQDDVYRAGNCFMGWTAQEWNAAGMLAAYWPFSPTFGMMGQVGRLATALAADLVLTVVAGTPADLVGPNTFTAPLSILAPDFGVKHLFSTRHRKMALRHKLYPYIASEAASGYWFATT
jgi:hypothetical protein